MPIISGMRVVGKVYGDLTGSIFEPQVKSISNVATGTLSVSNGGTGTGSLASGGVLLGNGTSAITLLTGSADGHVLTWSSASNSWTSATASAGGGSGDITGVTAGTNLSGGGSSGDVTVNLQDTITLSIVTASLGVSASLIRFPDGTEISSSTGLGGGGLSTVYTDGVNILGDGSLGSPVSLDSNITLTSVTASLFGNATTANFAANATYAETASTLLGTVAFADAAGTAINVVNAVNTLQGTANQVLVNSTTGTPQSGSLILTLPQSIGTTSSPTFLTPTATTGYRLSYTNGASNLYGLEILDFSSSFIPGTIKEARMVRFVSSSNAASTTVDNISIGRYGTTAGITTGIFITGSTAIYNTAPIIELSASSGKTGISNNLLVLGSVTGSIAVTAPIVNITANLSVTTGSNKASNVVSLDGNNPSTATVSNLIVTANSIILLTKQSSTYPSASLSISSKSSTSFTIASDTPNDNDSVAYLIINPS